MNKFQLMILANTNSTETFFFFKKNEKKNQEEKNLIINNVVFINDYIASSAQYTEFWVWLTTTNDEIKIY